MPRSAHLRAFWSALCLLLGCGVIICGYVATLPYSWICMIVFGLVLLLILGLVKTDWVRPFYDGWNSVTDYAAVAARRLLLAICFSVIFMVSLAGARFRRQGSSAASCWDSRPLEAGAENLSPFAQPSNHFQSMSRTAAYFYWARRSSNLWALVLLPFLWVLFLVTRDKDDTIPAHVYTLF
jgi:hypothetical protein